VRGISPTALDPNNVSVVPSYWACRTPRTREMPFCNTSLSHMKRVQDIIDRLSLSEKVKMLSPDTELGNNCDTHTRGVPRLDIPQYMWLVETNTGVAAACLNKQQCSTVFPSPAAMAASFNRSSWKLKGHVISRELRAYNNANWHRRTGLESLIGVTGFGPNINLMRDPRFGRNSELPSEDPFLSGEYAVEYVNGCQELDKNGHPRMLAFLKHFTAYSMEANRGHSDFNISKFDLFDSYLPQYKRAFQGAKAAGVMCSYNAVNGLPSCANGHLLQMMLRGEWKQEHALVTSDCGAVNNLMGPPVSAPTNESAAAMALNNGTDIEMGSEVYFNHLQNAVRLGLTSTHAVDAALKRSLLALMRTGRFDPVEDTEWTRIAPKVVGSKSHKEASYEAALQSFVLLKNSNEVLPLKAASSRIAVLGPQSLTQHGLLSDYAPAPCFNASYSCITTIADAIKQENGKGGETLVAKGVDINSTDTSGMEKALRFAQNADVVVLVLGDDFTIETEGKDRESIQLPGIQQQFALKVLALGKPSILVLVNGGAMGIESLADHADAIIEAFYPGPEGGQALAHTIFGKENRWGRLPYTMYPSTYVKEQNMSNYDMAKYPGRTYRYYQQTPVFPFGSGLSYTTFALRNADAIVEFPNIYFHCSLYNEGRSDDNDDDGDDAVLLLYHIPSSEYRSQVSYPVPFRRVIAFDRVRIGKGKMKHIRFTISVNQLGLTNADGVKHVYAGKHTLLLDVNGRGSSSSSLLSPEKVSTSVRRDITIPF